MRWKSSQDMTPTYFSLEFGKDLVIYLLVYKTISANLADDVSALYFDTDTMF